MDVLKINMELLRSVGLERRMKYFVDGDFRWVIPIKGHWLIKLHKSQFYLADWLFDDFNGSTLFAKIDYYEAAEKTNDFYKNGKSTYVKMKSKEQEALLDESYVKLFDKKANFKVLNSAAPVAVYEKEELVGLIMSFKRV